MSTDQKPVCVRHRDGWCATRRKHVPPDEPTTNQPTICRHYVVLPWGYERREPDCPECLNHLSRRKP